MKKKRNTILFFILLFFLICVGFLIQKRYFGKNGVSVTVQQNGQVLATLPLNQDTELYLDDGAGGTNTLVIEDHKVFISEANCPDLVCVRTGAISKTGEAIACLPHKLILTVSGQTPEGLDSTTW